MREIHPCASLDEAPVCRRAPASQPLAPHEHRHKRQTRRHADARRDDKRVLPPHARNPRRDGVADGKHHGVPQAHCRRERLGAQLPVAVNEVIRGQARADGVLKGNGAHCDEERGPAGGVRGTDAPEDEGKGGDEDRGGEEPQAVLGLGGAVSVCAAGEAAEEAVGEGAGEGPGEEGAEEGGEVAQADGARGEVVGRRGEDGRGGRVEHRVPDCRGAVGEAGVEGDRPEEEGELELETVEHHEGAVTDGEGEFVERGLSRLGGGCDGDCGVFGGFNGWGARGGVRDARRRTIEFCLFEEKDEEDESDGAEDGRPVVDPLPALPDIDEAEDDGCDEVAPDQDKGVHRHVPSPLV